MSTPLPELRHADPRITRDPQSAARTEYDLIVVGGGILGTMTALEAATRNIKTLLLEKDDFGSATSFNSLKTIHGGLRHLQFVDFQRHRRFVNERRWFLKEFPGMVEPLPVLMPLYGRGLRRKTILRAALTLDRALSRNRNEGVSTDSVLPDSRIASVEDVRRYFPLVDERGLRGGAVWYDARVPDTQRLIIEIVGRACDAGATALNYVEVTGLETASNRIAGVSARDALDGTVLRFSGSRVINATGPWSRRLAALFDRDAPGLFHHSMAWNILLDREALSRYAIAVAPDRAGGQIYFLHPWKGRILAGTGHARGGNLAEGPTPSDTVLNDFLDDVNRAVPSLRVTQSDVLHVYSGFLPVRKPDSDRLTNRPTILEHHRHGGPAGLVSAVCDKFTAARYAAEKALRATFGNSLGMRTTPPAARQTPDKDARLRSSENLSDERMRWIIRNESVQHLDDLMLRRTTLGDDPRRALTIAPLICHLFDWDGPRRQRELQRLAAHFNRVAPDEPLDTRPDKA